jgi:putative ABC transport system permease protein
MARRHSLFHRKTLNAGMADEFAFHMQARAEHLMRGGLSREAAERIARLEFGSEERYRAECRESGGWHWLDELAGDARYAVRNLRKSPAFSIAAIVPLALGLAAVAVMFAVVNTILLQPLPFNRPDRVVTISQKVPLLSASPTVITADEFQLWEKSGLFESAAIVDAVQYTLEGRGHPERIYGTTVTPDFFRVFKLQPVMGRGFSASDAVEGAAPVILLSHQLWVRRFESDRNIVGQTVLLSGARATVIGVMPAGFDFPRLADVSAIMNWAPEQSEFWTPLAITPKMIEAGDFNYYAVGRLRDGITCHRAAAQLRTMVIPLWEQKQIKFPEYKGIIQQMLGTLAVYVTPMRDTMSWRIRGVLYMLVTAVALLLSLVLFNLGSLVLTRNAQRSREFSIRQTLGAGRWRLLRQSFIEQVVLVGIAAVCAAALMVWGIGIVKAAAANHLPRIYELDFSFSQFLLLAGLAVLTAAVFGTLSHFIVSETMIAARLKSSGRTATSDRAASRARSVFIAAEIAISLMLLVGAGLLMKTVRNVMNEKPGFNPHDVLTAKVPFNPRNAGTPEQRLQHVRELLRRFEALPGVTSASLVSRLPLSGDNEIHSVTAAGKPLPRGPESISAEYRVIGAHYFRTMQIPLISGREFKPDDPGMLAVINETMAARLWPGEPAIGKRFSDGNKPPLTVIGVIGDVHNGPVETPVMMQFYRLISADPYYADTFVIRSSYEPESLAPAVQKAVWQLDASEPVAHVQTMEHLLESITLPRRFEAALLGSFAVVALFLSAVGLFSVASLSVARRTREFGIRSAVGATAGEIVRLELARTATVLVTGLAVGLLGSTVVARMMGGLLYRVAPWSVDVFTAAAIVLIAAALIAGWLPARRASRIDPASALRAE